MSDSVNGMFTRMPSDLNGMDVRSLEPQTPTPIYRERVDCFDEEITDGEDSILTDSQDPAEDLLNSPYFHEANYDKIMDDTGVQLSDTETDTASQQSVQQEEVHKSMDDSGQGSSDTEIASKYTTPFKQREDSPRPPPTPADREAVRDLGHVIDKASHKATFTCGGSIPIILDPNLKEDGSLTPRTNDRVQQQRITTKPVSIRWEADGSAGKISLPTGNTENTEALQELVDACLPATFGREGKDVFDESYRRAGAMSTEKFTTSFCPYELGIMDILVQLLVPSIVGDLQPSRPAPAIFVGFQEELNVRNVFQRFRKPFEQTTKLAIHHADIPEALSSTGFPVEEGCGLASALQPNGTASWSTFREHAEQHILEMKARVAQEWQPREGKKLFRGLRAELYKLNVYSGPSGLFKAHVDTPRSEEQIGSLVVALPIAFEAGHRITLTYNLYVSLGTGLLNGQPTSLSPSTLPLHQHLTALLSDPNFMPEGGLIGRHLAHSYPHTHKALHQFVPQMLKGSDMAIYQSWVAAGLTFDLTPYPFPLNSYDQITSPTRKAIQNLLQAMEINDEEGYDEDDIDSDEPPEDYPENSDDEDEFWSPGDMPDKYRAMRERARFEEEIVWLNGTEGYKEMRKAYLAYGNEATMKVKCSSVALIATVPTWRERSGEGMSVEQAIKTEE